VRGGAVSRPLAGATQALTQPLYPRLLRLKHLQPSAWQRAMLVEGSIAIGAVAALADKVSAWTPVVMPVAVAVVVKFHDVLTGVLRPAGADRQPAAPAAPVPVALPHVVVLHPGRPVTTPDPEPDPEPDVDLPPPAYDDLPDLAEEQDEPYVEEALPEPAEPVVQTVPRLAKRVVPGPLLASSAARIRAELDAIEDAAITRAVHELSTRGGLEPFVLRLDEDDVPEWVDPIEVLDLPGQPRLRAVVVCTDVALPGKPPRDAIRLEVEHVDGAPESVTAVYRHTGEGPAVVLAERTITAGRRSGVRRRFFAPRA
jgi:hypothetical protein